MDLSKIRKKISKHSKIKKQLNTKNNNKLQLNHIVDYSKNDKC